MFYTKEPMGATLTVEAIPDEIVYIIARKLDLVSLLAACGTCRQIRSAILTCPFRFDPTVPLGKIINFHITDRKGMPREIPKQWYASACPEPVPSPLVWIVDDFVHSFKADVAIHVQIQGNPPFSVQEALPKISDLAIDQRALACEMQRHLGEKWVYNFLPNTSDDLFYHSNSIASPVFKSSLERVSKLGLTGTGILPFVVSTFIPGQPSYTRRHTVHGSKKLLWLSTLWSENKINAKEYIRLVSEHFATFACYRLPFYDQLTIAVVGAEVTAPRFRTLEMYDGIFFPHERSFPICHSIDWACVCRNINCGTLKIYWLGVTLELFAAERPPASHRVYGKAFDTYSYLQFGDLAEHLEPEMVGEVEVIFLHNREARERKLAYFNELRCNSRPKMKEQWREHLLPAQVHTTTHWRKKWQRQFFRPLADKSIKAVAVYK